MTALRRLALPAFIIYAIALFTATHWPQLRLHGPVPRTDIWIHFLAFGLWTVLLIASGLIRPRLSTRSILKAVGVGVLYASFDETLQLIPALGRTFGFDDMAADFTGVALGGVAMLCLRPFILRVVSRVQSGTRNGTHDRPASPADAEGNPLASGIRTVSGLTTLSRLFGLARDLITVRIFADTAVGSAFAAAFAIPNIFRRLFGEGALTAAFIPAYAQLAEEDQDRADRFATLVVGLLAIITGAITIAAMAVIGVVLASIERDPDRDLSLSLLILMLPYMPLICTSAILGGLLQTHRRFGPWAAAPIILNLCIIAASLPYFIVTGASPEGWAYLIGVAVLASGVLQVAWSAYCLKGLVHYRKGFATVRAETRKLLVTLVPALIGLGTLQLNSFLDTLIAMWPNWIGPTIMGKPYPLDEASNAILFYTQRLYQFPLGVFGIAVATVVFPELARRAKDPTAFTTTLRDGLRLSLFIGLPASAGLILVAPVLITTLLTGFGNGFSADGASRASLVLTCYGIAVWAYSLNHVLTRAFYAMGDTTTPMRLALGTVAINLTLNLTLIWSMREAGLALATSTAAVIQLVASALVLRSRLAPTPLLDADALRSAARTALTTLGMSLAVYLALRLTRPQASLEAVPWATTALRLTLATIVGIGSYLGIALITRTQELRWLISRSPSHE